MGGKRKVIVPLPENFPAVGTYVRYYHGGWYHGYLRSTKDGKIATIERFQGRDVKIPITDVEIPIVEDVE
jgi:hypothetical protein